MCAGPGKLAERVVEGGAACLPACRVADRAQAHAQVLEKTSGHPKALYRRAQAHMGAGDYVEAEVDIKAALQVPAWLPCPPRLLGLRCSSPSF